MFPIFLSNKKCRLEHVVNKLMSCFITDFLWLFSYKLHGILSNSMDTLWHSMELHRYFSESHRIPWNSTIFHGILMAFHGTPSLLHGTPWNSMAFHGTPWILHGNFVEFHGFPWISLEFHGFHRFPWISMDFHGIPWRYFTRDLRLVMLKSRPCRLQTV